MLQQWLAAVRDDNRRGNNDTSAWQGKTNGAAWHDSRGHQRYRPDGTVSGAMKTHRLATEKDGLPGSLGLEYGEVARGAI